MTPANDAWLARHRARWLRPNAHLYVRPDAHRFMQPDAGRDVQPERKHHLLPGFERLPLQELLEGKAGFDPNQPRVPKGDSDGGQWTAEGIGDALASEQSGESDKPVQLAYLGPAIGAAARVAQKGFEAGLALFTWLSARNHIDSTAVIALPAQEFRPGDDLSSPPVQVGQLTDEELGQACPKVNEVQSMTDASAASLDKANYNSPANYGTAVHTKLRDAVRNLNDPDLRAEVSLLKTLQETGSVPAVQETVYGRRNSIRVDVLENAGGGTVCVYDIKTGTGGLSPLRVAEIARTVYLRFPNAQRIIVIETRPRL